MKQRIPTFGGGVKVVRTSPADATKGATVGLDLYDPSGNLVQWSDILNPAVTPTTFNGTSDDVSEGQWNLYFTNQRAQDAVGAILTNSSNITLTYDSTAHTIVADFANQSANLALLGPASGSAAKPTFRAITNADLPQYVRNLGCMGF